jgi:hypothetical protein
MKPIKLVRLIPCLFTVACAGQSPLTANEAIKIAMKMCAQYMPTARPGINWTTSDEYCDAPNDCWKVDGWYHGSPKALGEGDLEVFVPKSGAPPKGCVPIIR